MKGKTILISGASRGIGLAIALRFAAEKWNIVLLAKDSEANLRDASDQVAAAGGQVLALQSDVSNTSEIQKAVAETVARFGGIDVLVNNSSAPWFLDTFHTSPEQFDLVVSTSVRAAFFLSQACFPHLKKAKNPHIINNSPPLNLDPQWFKDLPAFSIGKFAMSLCTLGMSEEFKQAGIAVNSLWPKTMIATQRVKDLLVAKAYPGSRWPSIMADAALEIALRPALECTGRFFIDEDLLREAGVVDFSHYAVDPAVPLMQTIFVPLEPGMTPISRESFLNRDSGPKPTS